MNLAVDDRQLSGRGAHDAVWLIGGRLTGALCATAWLVVAARSLTRHEFGELSVIVALGTVVAVVTEAGVPLLVAEAAATAARPWQVVRTALAARVPVTVVGVLLLVITGAFYRGVEGAVVAGLYGVAVLASAVQTTAAAGLRATGRAGVEGVGEAGARVVTLAVGVPLLWVLGGQVSVALAYAIGGGVAAIGVTAVAALRLRGVHDVAGGSGAGWSLSARRALPLGTAAILMTLYNRIDLWALAWLRGAGAAGEYAAVYRLFEGLVLPAAALGALVVPRWSRAERSRTVVARHLLAGLALTGLGATLLFVAAPTVLSTFFGAGFSAQSTTLRLLCLAALPTAAVAVMAPLASLRDRAGGSTVVVAAMVVSATLNLLLVPVLGARGSAGVMVVSQSLLAALLWRLLRRDATRTDPPQDSTASSRMVAAKRSGP